MQFKIIVAQIHVAILHLHMLHLYHDWPKHQRRRQGDIANITYVIFGYHTGNHVQRVIFKREFVCNCQFSNYYHR